MEAASRDVVVRDVQGDMMDGTLEHMDGAHVVAKATRMATYGGWRTPLRR